MLLLVLVCVTLMADSGLGSDTYTDQDVSDPSWMALFTRYYQKGVISASPDHIEIVRVVKHHNHMWLLGSFDSMIYTLKVDGGKQCNVTTPYFLGSQYDAQPVIDGCGILVTTSDVPIHKRRNSVMAIDANPKLYEPLDGEIDVPNTNKAPRPAELQNAQD